MNDWTSWFIGFHKVCVSLFFLAFFFENYILDVLNTHISYHSHVFHGKYVCYLTTWCKNIMNGFPTAILRPPCSEACATFLPTYPCGRHKLQRDVRFMVIWKHPCKSFGEGFTDFWLKIKLLKKTHFFFRISFDGYCIGGNRSYILFLSNYICLNNMSSCPHLENIKTYACFLFANFLGYDFCDK